MLTKFKSSKVFFRKKKETKAKDTKKEKTKQQNISNPTKIFIQVKVKCSFWQDLYVYLCMYIVSLKFYSNWSFLLLIIIKCDIEI